MRFDTQRVMALPSLGFDLSLHASGKFPNRTMDGPFASWATQDESCFYTIPISGTLNQGQPVVIDPTSLGPNTATGAVAEQCLPNSNANSSQLCFGCYQGANIVNPSGTVVKKVLINIRQLGYGVIYAGSVAAGTAVTVGGYLALDTTHDFAVQSGSRGVLGTEVGIALATGAVVTKGATLIAVPGSGTSTLLINGFIQTQIGA